MMKTWECLDWGLTAHPEVRTSHRPAKPRSPAQIPWKSPELLRLASASASASTAAYLARRQYPFPDVYWTAHSSRAILDIWKRLAVTIPKDWPGTNDCDSTSYKNGTVLRITESTNIAFYAYPWSDHGHIKDI